MRGRFWFLLILIASSWQIATAVEGQVDFGRDVRPILQSACWKCHGADKQQGGLRFDRRDEMLRAGDSGKTAVSPGKIEESELIRRVEAASADERMPLELPPLAPEKIEILRTWIKEGALWPDSPSAQPIVRREAVVTQEDRQHWSYLPLRAVKSPAVNDAKWARTVIDRIILGPLEAKGIQPNLPAGRERLIRRLYFDLVGLPPVPADVAAFTADQTPDAYERLVDRLLASPHYGERWGRHWLDLARYSETSGLETDADRPNAYHYRDFVIKALNSDMSYQTFTRWQLAGDEYEPENPLAVAATGFLTGAPNEMLEEKHLEEERLRLRYNELDDIAVTTASAFLGLTLGCARCHDHKFDAIPTRDYYRLQCAFMTTASTDVKLDRAGRTVLAITEKSPQPADTWLLARGDFFAKKEKLQLGFFTVLTNSKSPEEYLAAARKEGPAGKTTLQRRALAEWMTDAEQGAGPLLARVMVNRIWQHHFGEGLCRTVSDFGVRGEKPTHPELLEYLTHDFVAGGWQIKRLHRQIVTSAVYMQDDTVDERRMQIDPDNRLLWRRRPERLEAEILRDAVLTVSGTLNLQQFGPPFQPPIPAEAIVARNTKTPYPKDAKDTPATRRRSVYMYHKRVTQHPLMQAFDAPDASTSCGRRNCTTVAPQALALLNDTFGRDRAADFAQRLLSYGGSNQEEWVIHGFQLALGRPPTETERSASFQFLQTQLQRRNERDKSISADEIQRQSLADFCQALFSLNEFIYVD